MWASMQQHSARLSLPQRVRHQVPGPVATSKTRMHILLAKQMEHFSVLMQQQTRKGHALARASGHLKVAMLRQATGTTAGDLVSNDMRASLV